MDTEKWMPVEGYDNKYEVSNLGRVKSHHKKKLKILLINYNTRGYSYGTNPMPEEWKKKGLGHYGE